MRSTESLKVLIGLCLIAAVIVSVPACAPQPVESTVFEGATLIDGTGAPPIEDAVVVVRDGRIECAGSEGDCSIPSGAETVDLSGRWIAPGLVDAHVHFAQTAWADGRPDGMNVTDEYPYEQVVAERKTEPDTYYRSYLCSGVTAVYDVGGFPWSWDLRDDAEASVRAPHVAAAGPLITWVTPRMSLAAEQVMIEMDSVESARAAARYVAAFDTDSVKVWFLSVPEESREEMDARLLAVGEEARSLGLPLIVHATSLREAKVALRAGAHLLVHSVSDQPVDEEFLSLASEQGTIYNPTLIVGENWSAMYLFAHSGETPAIDDPHNCVDPATRQKILSTPEYIDHPSVAQMTEEEAQARRDRVETQNQTMAENLRRVHEAGITIAMGTDAGNPFTVHGPSVYAEMERMQASGLEPADILVMATRNGAMAMGREDDLGTLEVGKVADFIVLEANPLDDIANLRTITSVARAGQLMPIAELAFDPAR